MRCGAAFWLTGAAAALVTNPICGPRSYLLDRLSTARMTDAASPPPPAPARRRPLLRRLLRATLYAKLALATLIGVATGVVYLRLSAGPISLQGISQSAAAALADRIGPGWTVTLNDTALELSGWAPAVRAAGIDIRNPSGGLVVRAPYAVVSLDAASLAAGKLLPSSIELRDLQLRASIAEDGTISFVPPLEAEEGGGAPVSPASPPAPPGAAGTPPMDSARSSLSVAVASLFDLIFKPTSIVGALDSAQVSEARLTLVGSDGRERVAFSRVSGNFEKLGEGRRRFSLALDGARGAWKLAGDVHAAESRRREGRLTASNVPVHDLLLLTGLSRLPGESDLKLSGEAHAVMASGRLLALQGRFETSSGRVTIEDPDMPPIRVDRATADASWNEERRSLALANLVFLGGGNDVRLGGEVVQDGDRQGWTMALTGRDAVVEGAAAGDPSFKLADVAVDVRLRDGGVLIDRLAVTGQDVGVTVSGSFGTPADRGGLKAAIDVRGSDARRILRLWPTNISTDARHWVVAHLAGGFVERVSATVAMDGDSLRKAMSRRPIDDGAVDLDFSLRDAELAIDPGLPRLTRGRAQGRVSGRQASIEVSAAQVTLPEGRAMTLSEGAFRMKDFSAGPALIGFRLQGGVDALATLMQAPMIRRAAAVDLDPAGVKGRSDLRVDFPLSLNGTADVADLPITLSGLLYDLTIDKAFGHDRLEAQALSVIFDKAGLTIRGECKLSGTPATLDVRQPKNKPGEATVAMVLDDAARARRGLGLGTQVTGPVAVRATVPLSKEDRNGTAIELDLARTAIDGLIPGWSKAAGKPGKAAFILRDTEGGGSEIRDLTLDSSPVLIKGTLTTTDGGLEKADLATFKLSPGDDMRVQAERAAGILRIQARGNVADARPFIRALTATGTGGKSTARDGPDVDLDIAANILTGFNDEAMTAATVKASLRSRELRAFQLSGRLRSSAVAAQVTTPRGEGSRPLLVVQTADAGATLRFVDLYRRMIGGSMVLQTYLYEGSQVGNVTIDSFELRGEPALKRIISQQPPPLTDERSGASQPRINAEEVHFTKLQAEFERTAGRTEIRDAVIWGPQIGFKLSGFVDYGRDRTDIAGTFVPAYGLNNVFSQVPVVGLFLGGGQNEGLFAVNFRVYGQATQPTLAVNPLSVVAPGIFRKLFGTGGGLPDTTGATAAPPLER
jgi:hypothetical protein